MLLERVLNYLYYYYVKTDDLSDDCFITVSTDEEVPGSKELVERGTGILRTIFEREINSLPSNAYHVVPLSGGLDSRAILGGLLEAGITNRAIAVTFGTPGTLDFELGALVAKKVGISHVALDLRKMIPETEDLLDTIKTGGAWTYLFDAYFNRLITRQFGKDVIYWSGFMGGQIAGWDLPRNLNMTWEEAKEYFVNTQKWVHSTNVLPSGYDPTKMLPEEDEMGCNLLHPVEKLNFYVRQQFCIRPIVQAQGYRYVMPFLDSQWIGFMLKVEKKLRQGCALYHRILLNAYPNLMMLPTKTKYGLPLACNNLFYYYRRLRSGLKRLRRRHFPRLGGRKAHPMINYIDFDTQLRENPKLSDVIRGNLADLERRKIVDWVNPKVLWKRHQQRAANHADALVLLASLEINLKAEEEIS